MFTRGAAIAALPERLAELAEGRRFRAVRLQYADLHGRLPRQRTSRSRRFCARRAGRDRVSWPAIMTTDLRHNVIAGFRTGLPRPARSARSRHASCRCRGSPMSSPAWSTSRIRPRDAPSPLDSPRRAAVNNGRCGRSKRSGVSPIVGPELEFYLCEADPAATNGYRPYASQHSPVYTVGDVRRSEGHAEPDARCGPSDSSWRRSPPPTSTGRAPIRDQPPFTDPPSARLTGAFRYKSMVKETGGTRRSAGDLHGEGRSTTTRAQGFHIHVSFEDADGANVCEQADGAHGPQRADASFHGPACSSTGRR